MTRETRFLDGRPDDELIAAVVALAIEAYLQRESDQTFEPVASPSRWLTAGRLESRGIPLSPATLTRGWGASG